jgi:ASCH domain
MMMALTVRQPWAAQLVTGRKIIEWRSWPTRYRGPLLIHAGRRRDGPDTHPIGLVTGAIIGQVTLVRCEYLGALGEADWAWHMIEPIVFRLPIPLSGRQGLFEVDTRRLTQLCARDTLGL